MPIQINRGVLGKEFPPYAVTVERGKVKEFARAMGDLNPFPGFRQPATGC